MYYYYNNYYYNYYYFPFSIPDSLRISYAKFSLGKIIMWMYACGAHAIDWLSIHLEFLPYT